MARFSSRDNALEACRALPQRDEWRERRVDRNFNALIYAAIQGWDDVMVALIAKKQCNVNDEALSASSMSSALKCAALSDEACVVAILGSGALALARSYDVNMVVRRAMEKKWEEVLDAVVADISFDVPAFVLQAIAIGHSRSAVSAIAARAVGTGKASGSLSRELSHQWGSRVFTSTLLVAACEEGPCMNDVAVALVRSGDANVVWNDYRALQVARKTGMSAEVVALLEQVQQDGYYIERGRD